MLFTICICTRRRPLMLANCLNSLLQQEPGEGNSYSILVVENDDTPSSQFVVDKLKPSSPVEINYALESARGIPHARNRALQETKNADIILFIDDDEIATPDWLQSLSSYASKHNYTSILHGYVISDFPPESPEYLHPFIQREAIPTGTKLSTCATNNVWIPTALIEKLNLTFDETYALTGGEDTVFFLEASRKGAHIFECHEAVVHEIIPDSRVTITWIAKRHYRIGMGKMDRKIIEGQQKNKLFPKTLIQLTTRFLTTLFPTYLFSKQKRARQWFKTCYTAGALAALTNHRVDAYEKVDGQ